MPLPLNVCPDPVTFVVTVDADGVVLAILETATGFEGKVFVLVPVVKVSIGW